MLSPLLWLHQTFCGISAVLQKRAGQDPLVGGIGVKGVQPIFASYMYSGMDHGWNSIRHKQPNPHVKVSSWLLYFIVCYLYYKNLLRLLAFAWEQTDKVPWNLGGVRSKSFAAAQGLKANSPLDPSSFARLGVFQQTVVHISVLLLNPFLLFFNPWDFRAVTLMKEKKARGKRKKKCRLRLVTSLLSTSQIGFGHFNLQVVKSSFLIRWPACSQLAKKVKTVQMWNLILHFNKRKMTA